MNRFRDWLRQDTAQKYDKRDLSGTLAWDILRDVFVEIISETAGDSIFQAGESVIIWHARVDKKNTGQITIHEGISGAVKAVLPLASEIAVSDAKIEGPFFLPDGFHVVVDSGTCTFEIVYEVAPSAD